MTHFSDGAGEPFVDLGGGVRRRIRLHLPELMIVEIAFEPGAAGALHSHPHVQTSYVEEGSFEVTIAGETRHLGKGGCYIVPPNAVHGVLALEKGVLIDVFAPRRDDFLG